MRFLRNERHQERTGRCIFCRGYLYRADFAWRREARRACCCTFLSPFHSLNCGSQMMSIFEFTGSLGAQKPRLNATAEKVFPFWLKERRKCLPSFPIVLADNTIRLFTLTRGRGLPRPNGANFSKVSMSSSDKSRGSITAS